MNGVREVDEGHKFCFGFSLLKTRSPKLRWQALHHTDNHFIFFVCNGLIVFGRLITTISSSKVLECKDFFFVCESCQLTWTLFLSYVRLLCPFNANKKGIKMYYGSNTITFSHYVDAWCLILASLIVHIPMLKSNFTPASLPSKLKCSI